jgi:putative DNA methylase
LSEPYRKKLIEVALPLVAINRESAREKSIRHGHPSTLHLWWARRPLAACRAVLFASIVDDPSSRPDLFATEAEQEFERQRLFGIIERIVKWENSNNETVLAEARAEIMKATDGDPPPVLDPFCGGGSIPLEAQRLGLEAHASDLNPVAVLITKALIEIPPKFDARPPVNPKARETLAHGATWKGAQGLAEDVRHYAEWMCDRASERIGNLYPNAKLADGREERVIAWIWTRTVTCPNPACGARMPLLNNFALSRRKNREAWLEPVVDLNAKDVGFRVRTGSGCPPGGTVSRTGATCPVCQTHAPLARIREIAKSGDLRSQLVCTICEGDRRRLYLDADAESAAAAQVERPSDVPTAEIAHNPRAITTPNYGITRFSQLFTDRQLVALTTFANLVEQARVQVFSDSGDEEYATAVATYLGLVVGRLANRCSSQCFWDPSGDKVNQTFARNALPMVWTYAEANPFSNSSGNFLGQAGYLVEALSRVPGGTAAIVDQLDAAADVERSRAMVCTDPPYYDNVPYADLSDFFYLWLRRCFNGLYPDLFSTLLVPKAQELIAEPARQGTWEAAAAFFELGLRRVFELLRRSELPAFPMTLFYAFRQSENSEDGGLVSTGWEKMLEALLDAGCSITATWPIRTEQTGGLRELGRNALASSIVLVCRPRTIDAGLATRRDFIAALRAELPDGLRKLQHGNIAPVDLAQAAIGPGMAIFSRYARVIEADGAQMTVRAALGLINASLDEILAEQEGDFDSDTRFAVAWFEQHGMGDGPFGEAETLSRAKNTAVNGLVEAGVLLSRAGKVRLLSRDDLDPRWDPTTDRRLTVWEVTQHLAKRLAVGGEDSAADLLRRVGGLGEAARELAYRLYGICERKKWAEEALGYNALVVSWPEIQRLAAQQSSGRAQQTLEV